MQLSTMFRKSYAKVLSSPPALRVTSRVALLAGSDVDKETGEKEKQPSVGSQTARELPRLTITC